MPPVHRPAYTLTMPGTYREGPRQVTLYACGSLGCTAPAFGCRVAEKARRLSNRFLVVLFLLAPIISLGWWADPGTWQDVGRHALGAGIIVAYVWVCLRSIAIFNSCPFANPPIGPENLHDHR